MPIEKKPVRFMLDSRYYNLLSNIAKEESTSIASLCRRSVMRYVFKKGVKL